ncbi:hypothetical protein TNCV_4559091 [Trichonephila clavipes]|nr:hypothetical protein TNCV_4559091 [Trichonephila clavipes]
MEMCTPIQLDACSNHQASVVIMIDFLVIGGQLSRELRSYGIPVMPHYNGQMAIFSGRQGCKTTSSKISLDRSNILKLFP